MDPSAVSIRAALDEGARAQPDATYLIRPETGRSWTYGALRDQVMRVAARLRRTLGVRPGDRVGIVAATSPELVFTWLATMALGVLAVPINTALRHREIAYILGNCSASALVVEDRFWPEVQHALADLPDLRSVAYLHQQFSPGSRSGDQASLPSGILPFDRLLATPSSGWPESEPRPDDGALIIYTSGTTGQPKGAVITHRSLLVNAGEIARWHQLTSADRSMLLLPLFHANGLVLTLLTSLFVGASVVLPERFSASRFWKDVATHRVVWFSGAPTILSILLNTPPPEHGLDVSSLEFVLCGTAPLPVELFRRFEERFGVYIIEGYGMTETTCRSTFNPHPRGRIAAGQADELRKIGSVGLAIGNEMQVVDDLDRPVGDGVVGEIVIRGENVMSHYFGNEAATAEAFRSGWLHSGDLGYRDGDRYYHIVDRKKDIIIRGGENISPREVDEVLYQHPAVREAATVGVPDAKYGEEVRAYVALTDGATASVEELVAFCRERLAMYKCPKVVEILPELPKGPTGKLLRRELREWAR